MRSAANTNRDVRGWESLTILTFSVKGEQRAGRLMTGFLASRFLTAGMACLKNCGCRNVCFLVNDLGIKKKNQVIFCKDRQKDRSVTEGVISVYQKYLGEHTEAEKKKKSPISSV